MDTSSENHASYAQLTENVGDDSYGGQPTFDPRFIPRCTECGNDMRFGFELLRVPYFQRYYSNIHGLIFFGCGGICMTAAVVEVPKNSTTRKTKVLEFPNVDQINIVWNERVDPMIEFSSPDEIDSLSEEIIEKLHVYKIGGIFPFVHDSGKTGNELGCIGFLPWVTPNLSCYIYHQNEEFSVELY